MGYDITISKERRSLSDYPVTLEDVRDNCNIPSEYNDKDTLIQNLIRAATQEAEHLIQKDIAKTRNVAKIWDFNGTEARIWQGNLNEIEGIVDTADASISYDETETRAHNEYFDLKLSSSVTSDPLTVQFITGFAPINCPETLKQAILIKVDDYFSVRGSFMDTNKRENGAFDRLLGYYMPARM